MKEFPILFSTLMTQALLEGRKTQTRRLVKWPSVPDWHHPDYDPCTMVKPNGGVWWPQYRRFGFNGKRPVDETGSVKCPYGQPGDLIWVRENLRVNNDLDLLYAADDGLCFLPDDSEWSHYRIREEKPGVIPSIHMPKEAARIWLQVTDVRVERLQDILQEDAQAEGVFPPMPHRCGGWKNKLHNFKDCFRCAFKVIWNQINGPSGNTWEANPWVFVISYRILSTTGKPDLNNL